MNFPILEDDKYIYDLCSTNRKKRTTEEKMRIISFFPYCAYCNSKENLIVEHIYPLSRGGEDKPYNITIACSNCNILKSNKTIKDFFVSIYEKRAYVYYDTQKRLRQLRNLYSGRKEHPLHSAYSLNNKISENRFLHSKFTQILRSILDLNFVIFK